MTFVAKNHRQKSVRTNGSSRFAINTEQSLSLIFICQAHAHSLIVFVVSLWTHSKNIHGNCPMNLISMCHFCGLIIYAYKTYTAPFVHPSIDAFILSFFCSLSIHPFIYHFIHSSIHHFVTSSLHSFINIYPFFNHSRELINGLITTWK